MKKLKQNVIPDENRLIFKQVMRTARQVWALKGVACKRKKKTLEYFKFQHSCCCIGMKIHEQYR